MGTDDRELNEKPNPLICPEEFCFFWIQEGHEVATGLYDNLSQALRNTILVLSDVCGCSLGVCKRLDQKNSDRDWYEPNESKLERAGFPWFYFIPSPEILDMETRPDYIRESELLWGTAHWQR